MGRPAGKWPTYALENLEESLYRLRQVERKANAAQEAIVAGDDAVALKESSDVRVLALECIENLVRARIGKYRQQESGSQWQKPAADQAAQAVERVVAIRRS